MRYRYVKQIVRQMNLLSTVWRPRRRIRQCHRLNNVSPVNMPKIIQKARQALFIERITQSTEIKRLMHHSRDSVVFKPLIEIGHGNGHN